MSSGTGFVQPDTWSILANLLYWLLLIVITLAKVLSLAVVAFGLIASAVCALLGPIFVPFFIVPKLDFLFWNWLKAFIQYSFIPVVAFAFLMIFERFVYRFLTTLPHGHHRRPVHVVRAANTRRDRHVCRRYSVGPGVNQLDILRQRRVGRAPQPQHILRRF